MPVSRRIGVAPARERGLKYRELYGYGGKANVAPARERGLKYQHQYKDQNSFGRSREGAWIEITTPQGNLAAYGVAPARERGLK